MLRLPQVYSRVLRDLRDTSDNPFYWMERRRENRSGEPWKGVWNALFLLAIVFSATLGGIWLVLRNDVAPDLFSNGRIPGWLGGGDGGRAAFALVAATHSLLVYYCARNLANRVLTTEARRGSLFQLLLSRLPAFEMVLEMTIYPFQQAMLIALCGLPLYVLLISFGSVGYQEVVVLYLLFTIMAIAVPNWRTPAFAEQSPEEVGQLLRDQERAAGCAATAVAFALLPGTVGIGFVLFGVHWAYPTAFARLPSDIWPALPAFPITFVWVTVRALTAPYTWFGLPLPPWVLVVPVFLLYRLTALWQVSLYLRVAHTMQIYGLPDLSALAKFRAGIRQIIMIGIVGYIWQPLLETGFTGALVWPNALNTDSENLSAFYYLVAISAFFFAMDRARKLGSTSPQAWKAAGKSIWWVLTPFVPLAVALLFGAIGMPSAFFTDKTGAILLWLIPSMMTMLFFSVSLGQGNSGEWTAIHLLPPFVAFIPVAAVTVLAGLSPLMVPIVANPALGNWLIQQQAHYIMPPWWSTLVMPLAGGFVCQWLVARGFLVRRAADDSRPAMRVKIGARTGPSTMIPPPVAPPVQNLPAQPPPTMVRPAANLEFDLSAPAQPATPPIQPVYARTTDMPPTTPSYPGPAPAMPQAAYGPPVIAAPQPGYGHAPAYGTPAWVAPPPQAFPQYPPQHQQQMPGAPMPRPMVAGPVPHSAAMRRTGTEWRWRPLSPLAAAVLRWLTRRTDNPVALYSARRVLPGTLNTDQITVALLALGLILLVAYMVPQALYILVIPGPVFSVIFPPLHPGMPIQSPSAFSTPFQRPEEQIALGMALVISFLVGVTLLSPWSVCKTVADGFRMERERSTLGFLLMTPLSSRGVAVGHCIGALLPSLALWFGCALCALVPTALLAGLFDPFIALWAWAYGFFLSLVYLMMCMVVGMWIGITEVKARDMTIGVYLLPFSFCVIAAGCAFYTWRYWQWNYFQYNALFVSICLVLVFWLWSNAMKELHRMRRGDVPFEGRTVSN